MPTGWAVGAGRAVGPEGLWGLDGLWDPVVRKGCGDRTGCGCRKGCGTRSAAGLEGLWGLKGCGAFWPPLLLSFGGKQVTKPNYLCKRSMDEFKKKDGESSFTATLEPL